MDRGTHRSPWKAISSLYRDFYQIVTFKVDNGNIVRFWEDIWLGENSLEAQYPSLFRISSFKSRPISEFWDQSITSLGDSPSWNFHFPRNLLDREICQLQQLLQSLERKHCALLLKTEEFGWRIHHVCSPASLLLLG